MLILFITFFLITAAHGCVQSWSEWTDISCNASCGAAGHMRQQRTCTSIPACICSGNSVRYCPGCPSEPCANNTCADGFVFNNNNITTSCDPEGAHHCEEVQLPPCQISQWTEWACNDTCGMCGNHIRTRACSGTNCSCDEILRIVGDNCANATCNFPRNPCCIPYIRAAIGGRFVCILKQAIEIFGQRVPCAEANVLDAWDTYCELYECEAWRYDIFKNNAQYLISLCDDDYAIGYFTAFEDHEMVLFSGIPSEHNVQKRQIQNYAVNGTFSWKQYAPDIRDQGSCGTCATFTVLGIAEIVYYKQYKRVLDLSESSMARCKKRCAGININMVTGTVATEYEDMYNISSVRTDPCRKYSLTYEISVTNPIHHTDVDAIVSALHTSPRSLTLYVGSGFGQRSSTSTSCWNCSASAHAVIIVGYEPRGWIVRNSWGTKWADSGYSIIPFNCSCIYGATHTVTISSVMTKSEMCVDETIQYVSPLLFAVLAYLLIGVIDN